MAESVNTAVVFSGTPGDALEVNTGLLSSTGSRPTVKPSENDTP